MDLNADAAMSAILGSKTRGDLVGAPDRIADYLCFLLEFEHFAGPGFGNPASSGFTRLFLQLFRNRNAFIERSQRAP
jgi:hypothetical protein